MMRIPSLSFATPYLVAGGSVLDGGVAGVVLVLVGWRKSVSTQLQRGKLCRLSGKTLTLSHGVGSRVYAVEDNEACRFR
jgi:hypothetical protein